MIRHNHYTVFSDESYVSASRYRSISSISVPSDYAQQFSSELIGELDSSKVREFKWNNLNSAKYRFAAIKIVNLAIAKWIPKGARVDTLIWDTHDERHCIRHRDDSANLGRMYFHLLKFVLQSRGAGATWDVYPDEHVELNWQTIADCLKAKGKQNDISCFELLGIMDTIQKFNIRSFEQCQSHKTPICQVCDLFAGIAVFSCNCFRKYIQWKSDSSGQQELFPVVSEITLSRSELERFACLDHLLSICKKRGLGVSIKTTQRLWTPQPSNPVNFWHYKPQHDLDKAPIKVKNITRRTARE